jgi:uncharacterized PurR-regulated membrane protein YhhQ (DUF165 family)
VTTASDAPQDPVPVRKAAAVERYRADELTMRYRLAQFFGRFADRAVVVIGLTLLFFPLVFMGLLTPDLPLGWFDAWASVPSMQASLWLSRGEMVLTLTVFVALLSTRRYGAAMASRAVGLSWLISLSICGLLLLYLAPQLTGSDFPNAAFLFGYVATWYGAAVIAAKVYDLTRGGRWWRAPFLGGVVGLSVQALIFMPLAYADTGAPWGLWLVSAIGLKVMFTILFLGLYRLLRGRIRPRPGLGGGY